MKNKDNAFFPNESEWISMETIDVYLEMYFCLNHKTMEVDNGIRFH